MRRGAYNVVCAPSPHHCIAPRGDGCSGFLCGHRAKVLRALRARKELLNVLPACKHSQHYYTHLYITSIIKIAIPVDMWCKHCVLEKECGSPDSCHPESTPSGLWLGSSGEAVQQEPQAACVSPAALPCSPATSPFLHRQTGLCY